MTRFSDLARERRCQLVRVTRCGRKIHFVCDEIGRDLMAKPHASFACQNCGALTQRWQGRCEACGEWNTIVEESAAAGIGAQAALGARKGRVFHLAKLIEADSAAPPRILTGIAELDRVSGGGFVPGSVLLLGGDPGIGKSTLLIQACAALARAGRRVVYISGEEAVDQVRLRAQRLGLVASAGRTRRGDQRRGYCRDALRRPAPRPRRDQLDPDHVDEPRQIDAGNGDARCAARRRR